MLRLVAVASLLGGCDGLFGLSHVDIPGDATPDSIDVPRVTGQFHIRYSVNQPDGSPQFVEDVYQPAVITMTVRLDDGTTPAVDYHSDGTFEFLLASRGQSYALRILTPFTNTEYQSSATQLAFADRLAGRPFPAPVTLSTVIQFRLGYPPGPAYVASTGTWSFIDTGMANTATFDLDWLLTKSRIRGPFGLLDATHNDRLIFVDFRSYGVGADTYSTILGSGTYTLTQIDGQSNMISGPAVAFPVHDLCTHVIALHAEAANRLHNALPMYTGNADDWHIWITPDYQLVNSGGIYVVAGADPVFPSDVDVNASYFNPFPGTKLLASMSTNAIRPIQLPGSTMPYTLNVGGREFQPVAASTSCSASTVVLRSIIAIPDTVRLGGTLLDADNKLVTLDLTKDVVVAWSSSTVTGPAHHATIVLYELINNAGATAVSPFLPGIVTARASATLDPTLLQPGHTYIIAIINQLGLPNAAAGDFVTVEYPVANMITYSGTFKVVAL